MQNLGFLKGFADFLLNFLEFLRVLIVNGVVKLFPDFGRLLVGQIKKSSEVGGLGVLNRELILEFRMRGDE